VAQTASVELVGLVGKTQAVVALTVVVAGHVARSALMHLHNGADHIPS